MEVTLIRNLLLAMIAIVNPLGKIPIWIEASEGCDSAVRLRLALLVYHGVLAPNAKWRREVVDFGRPQVERASSATTPRKVGASYNRTWAELMRRGLDIDVLECPDCGGRLRFVAAIMLSRAIRRILRHLGLPSDPVELAPARAPPELHDAWAC